jgi:hypothetical protein
MFRAALLSATFEQRAKDVPAHAIENHVSDKTRAPGLPHSITNQIEVPQAVRTGVDRDPHAGFGLLALLSPACWPPNIPGRLRQGPLSLEFSSPSRGINR